jgi:hypothetical protein
VTWLWISAIEPQQADHSQHESGKEDRQQQPIESNLGCSLRFDTQGSQVRVFGIQAKLLLSLISALVSPASAREKRWLPSKRAP